MKSRYRKISSVRSLAGGTKWYLSDDCLLAAKRVMYAVEYRRFYLRDLESIVVWPSGSWLLRLTIPAALLAAVGASFWHWVNATSGEIFTAISLGWVALELALGPTARSRIRTRGATVDLPLVPRSRRATEVLSKIDAAARATRAPVEHPSASRAVPSLAEPHVRATSEASATASVAAATETHGS